MADSTAIEWTDATWNPITGCSIVSAGCTNCYAMKLAGTRLRHHPSRTGLTIDTKAGPVWKGEVRLNAEWLAQPLAWTRPRTIFVCAHGDLFHESVPDEWIDAVFAVMALTPRHRYQVLTKRAARMRAYVAQLHDEPVAATAARLARAMVAHRLGPTRGFEIPLPNVWLGVSVEDQRAADERIPDLLATPAAIRFLSMEPLLGPVDLHEYLLGFAAGHPAGCVCGHGHGFSRCRSYGLVTPNCHRCACTSFRKRPGDPGLHWIIAGGESGPGARSMHPDWLIGVRDQCEAASAAFFFKQWGTFLPVFVQNASGEGYEFRKVGKKAAGRKLHGITHDAMPKAAAG